MLPTATQSSSGVAGLVDQFGSLEELSKSSSDAPIEHPIAAGHLDPPQCDTKDTESSFTKPNALTAINC